MSTDRELLELAAKAAVIKFFGSHEEWGLAIMDAEWWNPLTDDGDALRLAVNLRMRLEILPWRVEATHEECSVVEAVVSAQDCAATRRAIVRAAAEIGRGN